MGFADQQALARSIALNYGCPNFRWIDVPRVGSGAERIATFWDKLWKTYTDPLTAKEQEKGLYTPPPEPRISFTGTLDDAQVFFGKTSPINSCKNCPMSQWTDGLPIIVPTEEKVAEMLTGTSHKGVEYISYTASANITLSTTGIRIAVKKGDPMMYMPMNWGATVEKIAINSVMAGCSPKDLPVVLAAVSTGVNYMTTNTPIGYVLYVAGSITKDIGMNTKQPFHTSNQPSMSIGRAYQFCILNIGGSAQGSSNTNLGNPVNRAGLCFSEDTDSLPPGWLGQNELQTYLAADGVTRVNYKRADSIVFVGNARSIIDFNFSPSSFQNLNKGVGDLARALKVEGKPGNYNILEVFLPGLIGQTGTGGYPALLMSASIAKSLYDYGFKTKAEVATWSTSASWMTLHDYKSMGWFDYGTTGGTRTIVTSDNKTMMMKDAPDNTRWNAGSFSTIIVTNAAGADSILGIANMGGSAKPIDPWK
jgi:hypothetical protein